ncbi:NTP transferase domain-containing protein [Streptomyces diastaticus]|uniref:NTP transferase domain-containing protein n=1 Tax=Streptomyces diastaticus TaxID=1956 RepID=UPI0035E27EC0
MGVGSGGDRSVAGGRRPVGAFDAVVLAGGGARRLGGVDKPGLRVGGRALVDRVLAACAAAETTVVVAAPRAVARAVVWAREEPAGGGPLAALAAGVRAAGGAEGPEALVVLSADLPFLDQAAVHALLGRLAEGDADAVLARDADGRDQPLVGAYRRGPLARALDEIRAEEGDLTGLPLRRLTSRLAKAHLVERPDAPVSFDCDTWGDLAAARARIREHGHVLNEWILAAKEELGIDLDVDIRLLLDLARDAAHGVERPAAPLTTFLVGYAAGRAGGGPEAVAEAARKAAVLAERWAAEVPPEPGAGTG